MNLLLKNAFAGAAMALTALSAASPALADMDTVPSDKIRIAKLQEEPEEVQREPIPLVILAIDMSASQNFIHSADWLERAFSDDKAMQVFEYAGPQIIAFVPWAGEAHVFENTYHIVYNKQEMHDLLKSQITQIIDQKGGISETMKSHTYPKKIFPPVHRLIEAIKEDGNLLQSVRLAIVTDMIYTQADRLADEFRDLAQKTCATSYVIGSKVPQTRFLEGWKQSIDASAYDEEDPTKLTACYNEIYSSRFPTAVPKGSVRIPLNFKGEEDFDTFKHNVYSVLMHTGG